MKWTEEKLRETIKNGENSKEQLRRLFQSSALFQAEILPVNSTSFADIESLIIKD